MAKILIAFLIWLAATNKWADWVSLIADVKTAPKSSSDTTGDFPTYEGGLFG